MPTATYREFRAVLQRSGFQLVRRKKHETWEKTLPSGEILQVRLSHQMGRDIPTHLFHLMLRQARLSQAEFFALLQGR
jgi:predicted RNA binding protein YcfA (HicA-like mRNA interferase family)